MTSRETTGLFALPEQDRAAHADTALDTAYRLAFGAIGWPWLLYSLWGGTKASKARLLERLGLAPDALPHLGSWKADTGFLHRIVDAVETLRPRHVVELGAGASSLVCARALQLHGGGTLTSFDQHDGFVRATSEWLDSQGVRADLRHAPLERRVPGWPGRWYDLHDVPEQIDLLIIDGPPWAVHPYVRGAAASLFERLTPGAIVLLDDAARPGERVVARRWRREHPDMDFQRIGGSTKGTLIGRKRPRAEILPFPLRERARDGQGWRRAAAIAALLSVGWVAHDVTGGIAEPAHATSFVDQASASYTAGVARQRLDNQQVRGALEPAAMARIAGVTLPALPRGWQLEDVQVLQSGVSGSVALVLRTSQGELVSLYATRAETPAERLPLLERRDDRSVAYWESGPFAYALTGELAPARVLAMAAEMAGAGQ